MPDDNADVKNPAAKPAGKASNFIQKHKTALIVAGVGALVIILYIVYRNQQSNASGGSTGSSASGSAGGLSPSDYASLLSQIPQGPPGATGPAGPEGPQGPKGPQGPGPKHHKPKTPVKHKKPHTSSVPQLTANTTPFHTVQPGETTAAVAAKHGMDTSSLYGMNRAAFGSSTQARPGQRLQIHSSPVRHPAKISSTPTRAKR